jgi:hypothetical protein
MRLSLAIGSVVKPTFQSLEAACRGTTRHEQKYRLTQYTALRTLLLIVNDFETKMFIAVAVGTYVGLFYPLIVKWFKYLLNWADPPPGLLGTESAFQKAAIAVLGTVARVLALAVLGVVIAVIVALLNFVTWFGDADNQQALKDLGNWAYVSAFSFGFSIAALFAEPFKKP